MLSFLPVARQAILIVVVPLESLLELEEPQEPNKKMLAAAPTNRNHRFNFMMNPSVSIMFVDPITVK
jgi:hypothetical protein